MPVVRQTIKEYLMKNAGNPYKYSTEELLDKVEDIVRDYALGQVEAALKKVEIGEQPKVKLDKYATYSWELAFNESSNRWRSRIAAVLEEVKRDLK